MTEPFHVHEPVFQGNAITCRGCDLGVPKPEGMPDYDGAGMVAWLTWIEQVGAGIAAEATEALHAAGKLPAGYKVVFGLNAVPGP